MDSCRTKRAEERRTDCKVISDLNKNTIRISSYENYQKIPNGIEKLPFDIEIFQNLVDNICRKFDLDNGENLVCFGGCAIFNADGSLKCVENFLPKFPSLLKTWLKMMPCLHDSFLNSNSQPRANSDAELRKTLWEAVIEDRSHFQSLEEIREDVTIDKMEMGRTDGEFFFRMTIPERKLPLETNGQHIDNDETEAEEVEVEDPTRVEVEEIDDSSKNVTAEEVVQVEINESVKSSGIEEAATARKGGRKKTCKYKTKQGLPVPPRPVLSLSQEEIQLWFPHLVEKLSGKRFPTSVPRKFSSWDPDVDSVLTMKDFAESGPRVSLDWNSVSSTFCWKLKLAAAIILDKQGVDYTSFAEEVEEKHEKYSVNDLKLMSMSKNPETFEKLFVKKGVKGQKKPNYLDEFEFKSSQIVLQNLRLINARDKRMNGNGLSKVTTKRAHKETNPPHLQRTISQEFNINKPSPASPSNTIHSSKHSHIITANKSKPLSPTDRHSTSLTSVLEKVDRAFPDVEESLDSSKEQARVVQQKMPALKPIEKDFVFNANNSDDLISSSQKQRKKKSNESKEPKPLSQKYMCKNNFQKGDFLIHPSQLNGLYGPVKLVTFRRETKKVFLSVSEFETVFVSGDEVTLERSSHKNRSTPAKFLDSYIKINESIEILDKRVDKMRIKRKMPKKSAISNQYSNTEPNNPSIHSMKLEIINHVDEMENSSESMEDDSEMVIDETSCH